MFAESGAALALAPVFGPFSSAHYYISANFLIGFPVALATMGAGMAAKGNRLAGGLTLASAAAATYALVAGLMSKHFMPAMYEIMECGFIGGWLMATSAYLLLMKQVARPGIEATGEGAS